MKISRNNLLSFVKQNQVYFQDDVIKTIVDLIRISESGKTALQFSWIQEFDLKL